MSSEQTRRSRIGRLMHFLAFRLIPTALMIAVIWVAVDVVRLGADRLNERNQFIERGAAYAQTATAIAPLVATPEAGLNLVAQAFATNTPRPIDVTIPAVNTPIPDAPAGDEATATLPPVGTPAPLPTVLFLGDPAPDQVDVTAIPTRVPVVDRQHDLFNVLLMGSDGEITNDGFKRTDTMIILSINRDTGTVSMLSLPRDLFVYVPAWSMQRINLAYARGESGGWADGTFELLRQMILYNFGINVHYYALIDLSGFRQMIDMVGGIEIAVDCAIEDLPLIGAELPAAARRVNDDGYHVLDVGYYRFSGAEALWYARSRYNSSDFDRGRRQQQILRAVWRAARDNGLLTRLPELWGMTSDVVETNLRFEDALGLLPLALNLNTSAIENFALVRTYHTTPWQTPSGDFVQLPVYETMRPLLEDFYRPPTANQIIADPPSIAVYNGTTHADWDRVAASRLSESGYVAYGAGPADGMDYGQSILIDYTGQSKGSRVEDIAAALNIRPEQIRDEPDANRTVDYAVILGSTYNSCTTQGILPVSSGAG